MKNRDSSLPNSIGNFNESSATWRKTGFVPSRFCLQFNRQDFILPAYWMSSEKPLMRHHMFSLSSYFSGKKFYKKGIKGLSTQTEMY
jgi:hypothetical protein